jgi:putative membrane protein
MKRMKLHGVLLLLGVGVWLAVLSAAAADEKQKAIKESVDVDFARKASASGMAEVNLSELAVRFARDPAVRQFAQRMIADHRRASTELTQMANRHSIKLPPTMDEEHQKLFDKLQKLQGAEFDRAYMEAMVKDHEEVVKLFEAEAKDGKDQAMKQWAGKLAPIFKRHLEMARKVCEQSKGEKKKG